MNRLSLSLLLGLMLQGNVVLLGNAFQVDPSSSSSRSKSKLRTAVVVTTPPSDPTTVKKKGMSKLYYRDSNEDEVLFTTATATTVVASLQQHQTRAAPVAPVQRVNSWLEQPRHRQPDIVKAKVLFSLELGLGRVSMVAAVVLLLVEVTTGQSLPDQILSLMS